MYLCVYLSIKHHEKEKEREGYRPISVHLSHRVCVLIFVILSYVYVLIVTIAGL